MPQRVTLPTRLWRQARRYAWTAAAVDFRSDRAQWPLLPRERQEALRCVCATFVLGERAVAVDLRPLLAVITAEGRHDEQRFLTSFLADEANHVAVFERFVVEVIGERGDLSRLVDDSFRRILQHELKGALERLSTDSSAAAQVEAVVTYHLVVEGILAESGYELIRRLLVAGELPGLKQAIRLVARDEARHIAFGMHVLTRLVAQYGDAAYSALLNRLKHLRPLVGQATGELAAMLAVGSSLDVPIAALVRASDQRFAHRIWRLHGARGRERRSSSRTADIVTVQP
jgi:ribonucleoside-diphosphate reductase beta chain